MPAGITSGWNLWSASPTWVVCVCVGAELREVDGLVSVTEESATQRTERHRAVSKERSSDHVWHLEAGSVE